ncbi:glycerophosphodiester phosphodiesterase family protein [Providencia rettgeri]|uniref:glycerophosphodiester phosphodiesterase family protein n=1 Tax=Providencia rettgeri TaxID=587 RepID=UPI002446A641|nr:glycerophosphodiester phosphodiesterase family protein [Providencia rettgeri]MDH2321341.1 glycerophosphodiester phosphodiesterase family protein [Providencia rettgeri]
MNPQSNRLYKTKLIILATIVSALIPISGNAACPTGQEQYDRLEFIGKDDTVVTVDHRGDMSGSVPENSLIAFRGSYKKCRHAIETDIRLSKDGALMVFHDANIGRVLEQKYNPDRNTGPNPSISSLTQAEIQAKKMRIVNWDVTNQSVPTVEEVISDYLANSGQALFYFDVKEEKAIGKVAKAISDQAQNHPDVLKRFIVKFGMEHVPTYEKWVELLAKEGANSAVMANPYISPWGAEKINKMNIPNPPGETYKDNTSRAVASWARQPAKLVPNVEVVIKNSQDFIATIKEKSAQGIYEKPTTLNADNTFDGTMARMITIIKAKKKALGIFVPNPDYIQWRSDLVSQGVTVKNLDKNRQIDIEEAYFYNTGYCCYTMEERLGPNEKEDMRMNLTWARSIGANVITVDDPDSVDTFFRMNRELDTIAIPVTVKPTLEMNSVLSRQLKLVDFPEVNNINIKPWMGDAAWGWGGVVCLWDNPRSDHYAWTYHCDFSNDKDSTYKKLLHTKIVKKHSHHDVLGDAIQIFNHDFSYCLSNILNDDDLYLWMQDCSSSNEKSLFILDFNRLLPLLNYYDPWGPMMITSRNEAVWDFKYYGTLLKAPLNDVDDWAKWGFFNGDY